MIARLKRRLLAWKLSGAEASYAYHERCRTSAREGIRDAYRDIVRLKKQIDELENDHVGA